MALKHAATNALLVITEAEPAEPGDAGLDLVSYLWDITARRIRRK